MLLEFSYENATKVLGLFNEGDIAQLTVKPVEVENERKFVFNYITLKELDAHDRSVAMKTLNDSNSYLIRMRVTEMLNKFIENMATNTVTRFELEFSVIGRTTVLLNTQVQFAKEANTITDKSIDSCFKDLNDIVTKMGITSVKVNGIFRREGSGKGRKHIQMTVGEVVEALQTILTEN